VKKIYLLVLINMLIANQISLGIGQSQSYLQLLNRGIGDCRRQLPVITQSAEQAASRTIMGARLWVAGRQHDFISEATERAGGLMFIRPLDVNSLHPNDSILYAVPGDLNSQDLAAFRTWNDKDVYVVAFASGTLPQGINLSDRTTLIKNSISPGLPVNYNSRQMLCPLDTVLNVLNLWTWTAEFASASLRQGKMPVFYQSYGIEGAIQRAQKYAGRTFHDDFNIPPIAPGVLGNTYVDAVQSSLSNINRDSNTLNRTIAAWRKAEPNLAVAWVTGHMFPVHFQDTRAPQPIPFKTAWHDQKLPVPVNPKQFVLYLGYQSAPQLLLDQAATEGFILAYLSVQPAHPSPAAANIIYINPAWPLTDACVEVPGYDISILPPSGVLNAAIYWSLLADYCQLQMTK
jgi:hypothetical protein